MQKRLYFLGMTTLGILVVVNETFIHLGILDINLKIDPLPGLPVLALTLFFILGVEGLKKGIRSKDD